MVPVIHVAIHSGVLAHGRDHDAIGKGETAQLNGRKQQGCGHESLFELPPDTTANYCKAETLCFIQRLYKCRLGS